MNVVYIIDFIYHVWMYTNVKIFGYSHCVSIIFVGAGFSYALRLIRVDRPHVPMWSQMLTAYLARGQLMYQEVFIYVEDHLGSTWCLMFQHNFFVNEISAPLRGLIM